MYLSIYEGNIFPMDIRYVDHDPLSRLQPIDNTSYATEADRIDKKKDTRGRKVRAITSSSEASEVSR
jgi:hypothetical protein